MPIEFLISQATIYNIIITTIDYCMPMMEFLQNTVQVQATLYSKLLPTLKDSRFFNSI